MLVIALSAGAATDSVQNYSQKGGDDDWYVRAGQFRFHIESKVAIRETFMDSDLLDETKTPPEEIIDHITTDSPSPVRARLTQSADEMTSVLRVKVQKPPNGSRAIGNEWRVLKIIKQMPAALWGACKFSLSPFQTQHPNKHLDDAAADPTPAPGDNINYIESILNGSTGKTDSTISQLVGYNFKPPKPSLPQTNFPTISVVESMSEGVFQQLDNKSSPGANSKNPLIPPSTDNIEKRPHEPPPAEQDGSPDLKIFAPPPDGNSRGSDAEWTAFRTGWKGADNVTVQAIADLVAGAFWWGDQAALPAPAVGGPGRAVLRGARPDQLLGDGTGSAGDEFTKYYISCPWVTLVMMR